MKCKAKWKRYGNHKYWSLYCPLHNMYVVDTFSTLPHDMAVRHYKQHHAGE